MNNLRIIRVHTGENWSKLWDAKNQNTGSWERDLWGEETVFCILGANSGALSRDTVSWERELWGAKNQHTGSWERELWRAKNHHRILWGAKNHSNSGTLRITI